MSEIRLTRWGWALAGFLGTLLIAWGAATIWTVLKERSNDRRITRIERIVIGVGNGHRVHRQVQTSSKSSQNLEDGSNAASQPVSGGDKAPVDVGGGTGHEHVTPGGSKKPPKSQTPSPDGESAAAPTDTPAATSPTTVTSPGQSGETPGNSGLVKPALEGIGSTAQDTVDAVPPVVCQGTAVLHPCH